MTPHAYAAKAAARAMAAPAVLAQVADRARAYMEGRIKRRLSGAVLRRQTGKLRDSLATDWGHTGTGVSVRARVDDGLQYARIHEEGGVIRGRPWLRIPIASGKAQARQSGDRVIMTSRGGTIVRGGRNRTALIALLRRQVTIPRRPYMRPSLEETAEWGANALRDGLRKLGVT